MDVTIREACARDAVGIGQISVNTWRTTYPALLPGEYLVRLSPLARARRWKQEFQHRHASHTYVASNDDSGLIAFGICGPGRRHDGTSGGGSGGTGPAPRRRGEIYELYVLDGYQGLGIGKHMMGAMARALIHDGYEEGCVWVLRDNPARWFYERLGGARLAVGSVSVGGRSTPQVGYLWPDLAALADPHGAATGRSPGAAS